MTLTFDQWFELESEFRRTVAAWAELQAEITEEASLWNACFIQEATGGANPYEKLMEAADSSDTFSREWKKLVGDSSGMDIAVEVAEESLRFRKEARFIREAMHPIKTQLRHRKRLSKLRDVDFDNELNILLPKTPRLIVDHAYYALYVAWRPDSRIIIPDNRPNLLRAMSLDESIFRTVTPRQFEELVAYVYECLGCRVQLTQQSRDFGADVLAWHAGPLDSEILIAVQVKRYAKENKVSLKSVFELHGAVSHYSAHTGHVVTSSDFTRPARAFGDAQQYNLVGLTQFQKELAALFG